MKVWMPRNARAGRTHGSTTCRYRRRKADPLGAGGVQQFVGDSAAGVLAHPEDAEGVGGGRGDQRFEGAQPAQPHHDLVLRDDRELGRRTYIASRTPNRNFFPGKSYLAKANAAGGSKNSTRSVVQTATVTVGRRDGSARPDHAGRQDQLHGPAVLELLVDGQLAGDHGEGPAVQMAGHPVRRGADVLTEDNLRRIHADRLFLGTSGSAPTARCWTPPPWRCRSSGR